MGRRPERPSPDWRVVMAGAAVGPLCAVISTLFELVKLQLQLDGAVARRASTPPSAARAAPERANDNTRTRRERAAPRGRLRPGRSLLRRLLPSRTPWTRRRGWGRGTAPACFTSASA